MSGASSTKRVLRTTAAAVVVGAVALTPLGASPFARAQEANPSALEPVAIRVGANATFTRIEFAGSVGSRARVRREGDRIVVRIGATAAPDVSRLRVDPPRGVTKVETRAIPGATEIVFTLAEGADARSGAADGAVYLNLYEQAPEGGLRPATPAAVASVPVAVQPGPGRTVLAFDWPEPVAAAVFRRGPAVWIVFDAAARLDLPAAGNLGPVTDARWASGGDHLTLRLDAPRNLPVAATSADGKRWTVTIGGEAAAVEGVTIDRDATGEPALVAQMAGAGKTIWITDPVVGDRFAAVTAKAPGKGFGALRRTVEMTLLPTAHGLAVETPVEDLAIRSDGDLVTFSRPNGLTLSSPSAALQPAAAAGEGPAKARLAGLIAPGWGDAGEEGFGKRYRRLQDRAALEAQAAADDPRAPAEARLRFARFLVGSGLGYEAVGVMNALIDQTPALAGEPEVRGLRGAARASIGRLEDAGVDFSAAAVAGDPAVAVWRGYIASSQGDHVAARQAFAAGADAVDGFPAEWRARFGASHALSALETGDPEAARALLAYVFSQKVDAADELTARLVQARLFELDGQTDRALAVYSAVARAPRDDLAVPAQLGVVRLSMGKQTLKPDAAAKALESMRWRWRGDGVELAVIRDLGRLYLSQGLYREALTALKGAGPRLARLQGAAELQTDLSEAFRMLFLEGGADGLQPVQALGLFYDFRELTPIGADGDEMVRRLARRLVDVDLLSQAAELLKHQVDERLEGVAKAQVATDLAAILLMNREPEPALQALWASRTTLLPPALNAERRALEARALLDLGRYDHALEVLGADASPQARAVRADVFWKQQRWGEAAALYEAALGGRHATGGPLTPSEEAELVRAGVGYSLAKDTASLTRLSRNYTPYVAGAAAKPALQVALDVEGGLSASPASFTQLATSADTFSGWVADMKTDLRRKTGGNRAAAPARSQATAPAPARPAA